jgi:hypothetical protein
MIKNEIDEFRKHFFEKVIESEKEKEKELLEKQRKCFHHYTILESMLPNKYETRTCSKCFHTTTKHRNSWNSQNGCVLS